MIIKEYRVILPVTVEEYQVGQLWSVAEASKAETGGGEGVQVLRNESFENHPLLNGKYTKGQYTHKIYHFSSKVPWIVKKLMPKGALEMHEEAWNAYPYCKTVITNPDFMKDNFIITIETMHMPDRGTTENAHELSPELLKLRQVEVLDIASRHYLVPTDTLETTDPATFTSEKTGRGPLLCGSDWKETCEPVMCAYKLVTCEFKWWGLQGRLEKFIQSQYPRMFTKFHREVFCWLDRWHGLTMEDIRELEEQAKRELDEQRREGPVRGMKAAGEQ